MFKNADEKATQRVTRLAKARISNACHKNFVILSVATKRVARRKPQQKNPQNLRHALNLWILRFLTKAQYDKIKSFWILRYAQYDKVYRYDKIKKIAQYDKESVILSE